MSAFLRIACAFGLACLLANSVFAAPDDLFVAWTTPRDLPSASANSPSDETVQLVSDEEPAPSPTSCDSSDPCATGYDSSGDCDCLRCKLFRGWIPSWDGGCQPTWNVTAGAIFLHRSRSDQGAIITPIGAPGIISNGGDFGFGWNAGPDVTIARQSRNGLIWEVRYFNNFATDTVNYPGVTGARVFGTNILGITSLTASYYSRIDSTEFNVKRPVNRVCTLLAGFRYLELHDRLSYTFNNGVLTTAFNDTNHLYGGQLGMNLALLNYDGPLRLNAAFKAGVYGNSANNVFTANGIFANASASGAPVAFVGDITVSASYQLTRRWAIRGGYQLLWLDGLALASNNAVGAAALGPGGAGINTSGSLFYSGATAALEFVW